MSSPYVFFPDGMARYTVHTLSKLWSEVGWVREDFIPARKRGRSSEVVSVYLVTRRSFPHGELFQALTGKTVVRICKMMGNAYC